MTAISPGNGSTSATLRIGAVNYLNSKPLIEGLQQLAPHAELRLDFPSRLADDLAAGRLDVALVPSIECLRHPEYEIVSDACVATRGPVFSVKLYSRVPMGEIRTLALDEGSRTSAVLARIMLAERCGVLPHLRPLPLGQSPRDARTDAVLLIGDRAMHPPDETFAETWDLGEEWTNWTGLPFVFAHWAARPEDCGAAASAASRRDACTTSSRRDACTTSGRRDACTTSGRRDACTTSHGQLADILSRARDLGVGRLDEIAAREAPALGISAETATDYLRHNLHFTLGSAERNGLKLYYELAGNLGVKAEAEVRPHNVGDRLEIAYRQMADDVAREADALEWCESTVGDVADESP